MFFAPWCGHCQNFKPTFINLAERLKGKVNVGLVDCTDHSSNSVCSSFNVKGYPTFYFAKEPNQRIIYSGPRSQEGLENFALDFTQYL
jgi:thioredoxin-like negative regulator of GroEL